MISLGKNYRRPFYYREREWTLDLSISDDDARKLIDDLFAAGSGRNLEAKRFLRR